MSPCVPSAWTNFSITWKHRGSTYLIEVSNPDRVWTGVLKAEMDGQHDDYRSIPLVDDSGNHIVKITMGRRM